MLCAASAKPSEARLGRGTRLRTKFIIPRVHGYPSIIYVYLRVSMNIIGFPYTQDIQVVQFAGDNSLNCVSPDEKMGDEQRRGAHFTTILKLHSNGPLSKFVM